MVEPAMRDQEAEYWALLKLMDDGKFSEAAPRFAALVTDATDARHLSAYGICLQKLGRWSQSIEQLQSALALRPAYCEADWRNMLAQSYLHDGQNDSAIKQWRIVASMEPTYPSHRVPIDHAKHMLLTHE
jgi:tetratricopeptide (TPR) repeat protein